MFVFFKQKTAYEMRISDWSSDVCSSDLPIAASVPSGVAIKVVATAILKLLPKACAHCGDSAITLYQRSDSPFSGKTRKEPELRASGTTARLGKRQRARRVVIIGNQVKDVGRLPRRSHHPSRPAKRH